MKATLTIGATLLSMVAFGQVTNIDKSEKGQGTLNISGRNRMDVQEVRVIARRGGDFEIRVNAGRWLTGKGTWNQDNRGLRFRLYTWDGFEASGAGSVSLDRNDRIEAVTFDARYDNRSLNLDFETGRNNNGQWGNDNRYGFSITQVQEGRGTWFGTPETRSQLRKARIDLRREGHGWITFTGDRDQGFKVNWRREGDRVTMQVVEGPDKSRWNGSGSIRFTRDMATFTNLELTAIRAEGRGRQSFRANFTSDFREWRDDDWRGGPDNRMDPIPQGFQLNEAVRGDGSFTFWNRRDEDVQNVRVDLRSNGEMTLEVGTGRDRVTFLGTWRRDRNFRLSISVREAQGYGRVSGTGWIDIEESRRSFRSIRLEGFANNSSYRLDFNKR